MYRAEHIRLKPQEAKALEERAIKVKCLYRSGTGICLNADVNAAANILKKIFSGCF